MPVNNKKSDIDDISKKWVGTVVSDKCDKTVLVKVDQIKTNEIYKKKYKTNKKYLVHDESNQYKIGDIVEFTSCKPISKNKHWIVTKIVK